MLVVMGSAELLRVEGGLEAKDSRRALGGVDGLELLRGALRRVTLGDEGEDGIIDGESDGTQRLQPAVGLGVGEAGGKALVVESDLILSRQVA
jgi:hypothetical protein